MCAEQILWKTFQLLKATSRPHVRDAQARFLLQPLLNRLQQDLDHKNRNIEEALRTLLQELKAKPGTHREYGAANLLHLFRALKTDLDGADFSGLTIRDTYLTDMDLRGVNFTGCVFERCAFLDVFGAVLSVAFSHNGELLAAGDAKNGIRIWDFETGRKLQTLIGHEAWVQAITFAGDARLSNRGEKAIGTLASCSEDPNKNIRLWDLSSGNCIQNLDGHIPRARCIRFSPDGTRLASCGDDGSVKIWARQSDGRRFSDRPMYQTQPQRNRLMAVAYSPDGTLLASGGGGDYGILLRRVKDLEVIKEFGGKNGHENEINALAFSPDGRLLASGSADNSVRVWALDQDAPLQTLIGHEDAVTSVCFDPLNWRNLASASIDHHIRLWDAQTGDRLRTIRAHDAEVADLSFLPYKARDEAQPQGTEKRRLVSAGRDNRIRIWDRDLRHCLATWQGYDHAIVCAAYRPPDGRMLASGAQDASITIWDLESKHRIRTLTGHGDRINHLTFHPSGTLLASGGDDRTVRLWDPDSGRCWETFSEHRGVIVTLTFSPDGRLLASCSHDGEVRLWSVDRYLPESHRTPGAPAVPGPFHHTAFVRPVIFHPVNGDLLATASDDGRLHLWSLSAGKPQSWDSEHDSWITTLAFNRDGSRLYSAADDGIIREWDTQIRRFVRALKGHEQGIRRLALSPDGSQLASASNDTTVRLWDLESGECLQTLRGHRRWVWSVAYSPDGTGIASTSEDEEIRLWRTADGTCMARLRVPLAYAGMLIEDADGLTDAQRDTLYQLGAAARRETQGR